MSIRINTLRVLLWPVACAIILCATSASSLRAEESAHYLSRASCASATCHGGLPGQGPAWNSSLRNWEAHDVYHAHAGQVLTNEHSKRMVMALARDNAQGANAQGANAQGANAQGASALGANAPDEAVYSSILKERCVGCHAPSLTSISFSDDRHNWLIGIREGVSCEACHGPASRWLSQHSLIDPDQSKLAASGKLSTKLWLDRTDNCLRCHIGSREPAGILRDMNHDVIAAGHPALLFDMSEAQFKLPAHWDVAEAKRFQADGRHTAIKSTHLTPQKQVPAFELATPNEHYQARARSLVAVTRLSLERHAASLTGHAPWPELAEFNCYACHQSIRHQFPTEDNNMSRLTWNSFYTQPATFDADLFPAGNARSHIGNEEMLAKLSTLLKSAEGQQLEEVDIFTALRSAAEQSVLQHARPDWQLATSWHWSNRLVLLNARANCDTGADAPQFVLSAKDASELAALLDEFGRNLEFNSKDATSPVGLTHVVALGPESVDFDRLRRLQDKYRSKLASISNRLGDSPVDGKNP